MILDGLQAEIESWDWPELLEVAQRQGTVHVGCVDDLFEPGNVALGWENFNEWAERFGLRGTPNQLCPAEVDVRLIVH